MDPNTAALALALMFFIGVVLGMVLVFVLPGSIENLLHMARVQRHHKMNRRWKKSQRKWRK